MRISGFNFFTATAIPAISPPPPIGMITASVCGNCFNISSPIEPFAAIT